MQGDTLYHVKFGTVGTKNDFHVLPTTFYVTARTFKGAVSGTTKLLRQVRKDRRDPALRVVSVDGHGTIDHAV